MAFRKQWIPVPTRSPALLGLLVCFAVMFAALPAAAKPGEDLVGTLRHHIVAAGETLLEIAKRNDLGFVELRAANPGVDPWVPPVGTRLILPTAHLLPNEARQGLIINLAEQRLYFFPQGSAAILTFPIGTGKQGWPTPLGHTTVVGKREKPIWVPPASIRAERPDLPPAVPPGPANPLGDFAIDLAWRSYVVHGTNKPYGIGRRVSHGCIRLYPEDITRLFHAVVEGTPVTVIDQTFKIGWSDGALYLEVHPTQDQADEIEAHGTFMPTPPVPDLYWRLVQAADSAKTKLNWPLIRKVAQERRGIPVQVTR